MKPVTYFLCLFIFSAAVVLGQTQSSRKSSLKAAIDQYSAQTATALSKEVGESYVEFEKKVSYSDVDNDGDLDAVVELSFCQSPGCDPITQSSNMAVFLKSKGAYQFASGKTFIKYNRDSSTEVIGKIKSIKKGKIYVAIYGCTVDDTTCLPRFLYSATYSFERKRQRLVRKIVFERDR